MPVAMLLLTNWPPTAWDVEPPDPPPPPPPPLLPPLNDPLPPDIWAAAGPARRSAAATHPTFVRILAIVRTVHLAKKWGPVPNRYYATRPTTGERNSARRGPFSAAKMNGR